MALTIAAPSGLMVELLAFPERTKILTATPTFGWIVNDSFPNAQQHAYQIQVWQRDNLIWDSKKRRGRQSVGVLYAGKPLQSNQTYTWQVQTWDDRDMSYSYCRPQTFHTGGIVSGHATTRYSLEVKKIPPQFVEKLSDVRYFVDFGKAAFAALEITLTASKAQMITLHFGEKLAGEKQIAKQIDRHPPGTIRHKEIVLNLLAGTHKYQVQIPHDARNTRPPAILMPVEIGEVMPYRYVEIEGPELENAPEAIFQTAVFYPFDDNAAHFESSDDTLNKLWDLCKYSIKATTFCGVYIDGDRERIAYEADAYINQLAHYSVDKEFTLARYTHEHLLYTPTWPTEWAMHSVLMAWEDYLYTGDSRSMATHYDLLKSKTLLTLAREKDGLISTHNTQTPEFIAKLHNREPLRDIVDWPQVERDGYEMVAINTVVNAFHYGALVRLAEIARVLGKKDEVQTLTTHAKKIKKAFVATFLDKKRGVFVDGENSTHASLHANMFALFFDLVPSAHKKSVIALIRSKRMACSVYAAQYLLDALYLAGEGDYAISLLTDTSDRSWANMLNSGSTITLEAWDIKYKPNLDWNHAWGAAPANLLPRRLLGVTPLAPGYAKAQIRPQPGNLASVQGTIPTIRGSISVAYTRIPRQLTVTIPPNMTAEVILPESQKKVTIGSGTHEFS
jgi:alpha-L-rhamnosidase